MEWATARDPRCCRLEEMNLHRERLGKKYRSSVSFWNTISSRPDRACSAKTGSGRQNPRNAGSVTLARRLLSALIESSPACRRRLGKSREAARTDERFRKPLS